MHGVWVGQLHPDSHEVQQARGNGADGVEDADCIHNSVNVHRGSVCAVSLDKCVERVGVIIMSSYLRYPELSLNAHLAM
jgi:hypothetical protein